MDQLERRGDAVALARVEPREQRRPHALVGFHRELEVLEHGVVLEHGRLLELAADAGVRDLGLGQAREVDRLAEERGALVGARLAGDHVHHRRLARAVRPDHAAQLAVVDGQRQLVQRAEAVEADGDAVEIEDRADATCRRRGVNDAGRRAGARELDVAAGAARHRASTALIAAARVARHESRDAVRQEQRDEDEHEAEHEQPVLGEGLREPALAELTTAAPITGPISVPRPPTAAQIAISIELAGDISLGLMMPTCGT